MFSGNSLNNLKETIENILNFKVFNIGSHPLDISRLLTIFIIIAGTKFFVSRLKKIIYKSEKVKNYDKGTIYSLVQIVSYLIWLLAIIIILDTFGLRITAILTGSAALLVGVGIGLQQTFNDFVSGVILLIEGATKVGDVLEVDGEVLLMKKIGLRTSVGINRDDIAILVPNSKITTDKVINWSHQTKTIRFRIHIGVSYGSDVTLVDKILTETVLEHPAVNKKKPVEARFVDFGNSSLNFQLLFYSNHTFRIEKIKSEIRKNILQKFSENGITIPFPQMDVHLKK